MYSLFFNAAARRKQTNTKHAPSQLGEQHLLTLAVYATLVAVAVIAYIS